MKVVPKKMKLSKSPTITRAVTSQSNPADVADVFLDAQGYDTQDGLFLRWYRSEWLRYTGKVFVSMPTEELKAEIMAFLQGTPARAHAKRGFAGDVVVNLEGRCRMAFSSVIPPARLNGAEWVPQPDCIVVENGIVDLKVLFGGKRMRKRALTAHTPSFVSQVCLPFKFNRKARCPKWQKIRATDITRP